MQVISIVNLKGGVGKTTTAVNMAYELAVHHNRRVLLIDADHQGNASKFYWTQAFSGSLADLIEGRAACYADLAQPTNYRNLDVLPSDMSLLSADLSLVAAGGSARRCLSDLRDTVMEDGNYDCMVIDCPPAFTAASVSAIAASTDIVIPIKLDYYAIDGMRELVSQLRQLRTLTSESMGTLITQWRNTDVIRQGEAWLRTNAPKWGCGVYNTHIRRTDVVDKSSYWRKPLGECSPRSAATADYAAFVREFLGEEAADSGTQI